MARDSMNRPLQKGDKVVALLSSPSLVGEIIAVQESHLVDTPGMIFIACSMPTQGPFSVAQGVYKLESPKEEKVHLA
jgi:hypothetical protein